MNLISVTSWYGKTSAIDTVDGASSGIAMCQIAFLLRDADSLLMSGIDRPEPQLSGAASLGKADLRVTLYQRLERVTHEKCFDGAGEV